MQKVFGEGGNQGGIEAIHWGEWGRKQYRVPAIRDAIMAKKNTSGSPKGLKERKVEVLVPEEKDIFCLPATTHWSALGLGAFSKGENHVGSRKWMKTKKQTELTKNRNGLFDSGRGKIMCFKTLEQKRGTVKEGCIWRGWGIGKGKALNVSSRSMRGKEASEGPEGAVIWRKEQI